MRGVSGDDPEGGAGSGVPRLAARNRSPRQAYGDPARQALRPGCEELAERIGRKCPRWKRGPRPKIATEERREARRPDRKGRQGASQAPGTPRDISAFTRVLCNAVCPPVPRKHRAPVGAPPPLDRGGQLQDPGANAPRERIVLFDIVILTS